MSLKSSNKTDVNMWELEFEIDPASFDSEINKVYLRQRKNITVKGFRKGKATRKLIERTYGENIFYEDAINNLIGPEMDNAVKELNLEIVDMPKFELKSADLEKGVSITAACVVKPVIEISDYKGLHAPKNVKEVTDDDILARIDNIRARNARMISVDDRAAQTGDEVDIDFDGYVDGEQFEGGKAENYTLKLGSGTFIPGFEDQIAGKNVGDEFDVEVSFPDDYGVETLAGKPAVFKCRLNEISYEELPELDDEFVKDATEFETVDELKEDTKKKLEDEAENAAETAFSNALMDALIAKIDVPVPHVMYERRVDDLIRSFEISLSRQNISLELYLQYTGMDAASLRETYMDRAVNEVKLRLALEAIAKAEGIEVSDAELDDKLAELARENNLELDEVRRRVPVEEFRTDILVQKAVDLVKETAVIDNSSDAVDAENAE